MPDQQDNPAPEPNTLCDCCIHQPECNQHHMMCISFEPVKRESDAEDTED